MTHRIGCLVTALMMRKEAAHFRIGVIAFCLLAACMSTAMAVTPAGTTITATGTAQYYSNGGTLMPTADSNAVTTTVSQVASVTISPTSSSSSSTSGSPAYFPATLTNSGNGSDTFALSTYSQNGSKVTIYKDDNGDGTHQTTETTVVTSTGALSAGSTYKVVVAVQMPSGTTSDTVTLTATSQFDATKTAKATYSATTDNNSGTGYILSWLVNLYYTNTDDATRLSTDYLSSQYMPGHSVGDGEANVTPSAMMVSGLHSWRLYNSQGTTTWPNPWVIDLNAAANTAYGYANGTDCAGYAHVYINSPSAQSAYLLLGSDNGIKVWLNGQNVWTNDSTRGYTADQDQVPVNLAAGWNRLLVKVSQYGGNWCFSAKLVDSSGSPLTNLTYATDDPPASSLTISNVTAGTVGNTTAEVSWDTDTASTTEVQYGTSTSYGQTYTDSTAVTHHVADLTGLTPNTKYYFKVGSADSSGTLVWNDNGYNFTTQDPANGYILSWLVNLYYTNTDDATRLSTDYLSSQYMPGHSVGDGEANVTPSAMMVSGLHSWRLYNSQGTTTWPNPWVIDLNAAANTAYGYANGTDCAGYAHVYINSPSAQSAYLLLGSDNGIKVWLNGQNVWTNDSTRGYTADQDQVPVNLATGWNRLLVKVSQYGGNWCFSAKLVDPNGNPLTGLTYATDNPQ